MEEMPLVERADPCFHLERQGCELGWERESREGIIKQDNLGKNWNKWSQIAPVS